MAARNYYIGTVATGDESGLNISNLCVLATANAGLEAGYTGYMRIGTYSTTILPSNSGTSGNHRIPALR